MTKNDSDNVSWILDDHNQSETDSDFRFDFSIWIYCITLTLGQTKIIHIVTPTTIVPHLRPRTRYDYKIYEKIGKKVPIIQPLQKSTN